MRRILAAASVLLGFPSVLAACDNPNADVLNNHVTCEFERATKLIVDCRCQEKRRTLLDCNNPENSAVPTTARVGTGPSLFPLMFTATIRIGPGYLDPVKREFYPAISFDDSRGAYQGFVLGVDLDTGNRRLVSGSIPGQGDRGNGPPIDGPRVTDIGPDGKLYVWSESAVHMKIFRVDLDTGDRELVWSDYDFTQTDTNIAEHAQCEIPTGNGQTTYPQTNENGFAVGPDGSFYVNVFQFGAGGVAKIAPDGHACSWLTLWDAASVGDPTFKDVGTGPAGDNTNFTALKYNKATNTVWGIGFFGSLTSIDVATGDRTAVMDVRGGTGTYSIATSTELQIAVLGGTDAPASVITVIDLPNNRVYEPTCTINPPYPDVGCVGNAENGPFPLTLQHLQPTWIDPKNGNLIMANGNVAFFRGELSTGNTILWSL